MSIAALIEAVDRAERAAEPCNRCGGTGWLYFRCGTPWRCKCSPMKFENRAKEAGQ